MIRNNKKNIILGKIFVSVLLIILLSSCNTKESSDINIYKITIENIDKNRIDIIDPMTGYPTNSYTEFVRYELIDIDENGVDELFVFRKYVMLFSLVYGKSIKSNENINFDTIGTLYAIASKKEYIHEAYTVKNGEVTYLTVDGIPVVTT